MLTEKGEVVSRVNRSGNRRNKGARLQRSSKAIPELLGTITNSVKLNPDMVDELI